MSPDGSHIAFQRSDFGREEWVMRSDGTNQVKVAADKSSWVGSPRWSPDGNRIAYIRMAESYNARESSIEVNDWRNPRAETLLSDNRLGPSLYWLPNGVLVFTLGDQKTRRGLAFGRYLHNNLERYLPPRNASRAELVGLTRLPEALTGDC